MSSRDDDNYFASDNVPDRGRSHTIPNVTGFDAGLPANIDCERTILGSILLDNETFTEAREKIDIGDFSLDSHQRIFRRMSNLMESKHAVDLVTLAEELARNKEIESVGGVAYLASLTENLPRRLAINEYTAIVHDKALLRRLMLICSAAIARAADQSESALEVSGALSEQLESAVNAAIPSTFQKAGDFLRIEFPTAETMIEKNARMTGIETGFRKFDQMTCGLQQGELTILAARPSIGKTSLMMAIAEHVGIVCESTVAIKSLEMKKEALLRRAISSRGRVPLQDHRSGDMKLHSRMVDDFGEAYNDFMRAPIFIDDSSDSAKGIVVKARAMKKRIGLDLLLIDYLGLFQHDEDRRTEAQQVGRDCLMIKWLARELGIPIVLLCQLSREVMKRTDKRPVLSDLRSSGNIEEHADLVTFIHREGYYDPKDEAQTNKGEWIISKSRNGPTGTVHVHWDPEYTRYSDPVDPRDLLPQQADIWGAIR